MNRRHLLKAAALIPAAWIGSRSLPVFAQPNSAAASRVGSEDWSDDGLTRLAERR